MSGIIRGSGVVVALFKEDWSTFLCYTSINVTVSTDVIETSTKGHGHWKKNAQSRIGWSATLSGALRGTGVDDIEFAGFDFMRRQIGFADVQFRASFTDENGNTRSCQGSGVVATSSLTAAVNTAATNDFSITGDGELMLFDGLIACDTEVTGATFGGLNDSAGNVTVTPAFTGAVDQIKYRVDETGAYRYAPAGPPISLPASLIDEHQIELIPVCTNGYEGIADVETYTVTRGLTCPATVSITMSGNQKSATVAFGGSPQYYRYRVDGGAWHVQAPAITKIDLSNLPPVSHLLEVQAQCSNGAYGTKASTTFTSPQVPNTATIRWNFSIGAADGYSYGDIYIDGIKQVHQANTATGTFYSVVTGQLIRVVLSGHYTGPFSLRQEVLRVTDTDTSVVISEQSGFAPTVLTYQFMATGDEFLIEMAIS